MCPQSCGTELGTNTAAPPSAEEKLTPAVPVRRSVQPDYVVVPKAPPLYCTLVFSQNQAGR